ncbi:MAG: hypothetical protein ACJ786_38350 [Catenulispora sp.]
MQTDRRVAANGADTQPRDAADGEPAGTSGKREDQANAARTRRSESGKPA